MRSGATAIERRGRRALATAAALWLWPLAAAAGVTETPAPTAEERSLQGFGALNPACLEWNDGCSTCKRDTAVHCSTPGIACQPVDIVCKAP